MKARRLAFAFAGSCDDGVIAHADSALAFSSPGAPPLCHHARLFHCLPSRCLASCMPPRMSANIHTYAARPPAMCCDVLHGTPAEGLRLRLIATRCEDAVTILDPADSAVAFLAPGIPPLMQTQLQADHKALRRNKGCLPWPRGTHDRDGPPGIPC
jgi:hypothetical protein